IRGGHSWLRQAQSEPRVPAPDDRLVAVVRVDAQPLPGDGERERVARGGDAVTGCASDADHDFRLIHPGTPIHLKTPIGADCTPSGSWLPWRRPRLAPTAPGGLRARLAFATPQPLRPPLDPTAIPIAIPALAVLGAASLGPLGELAGGGE